MILGRSLPGLGDLELVEVYEFFDEPVLYTCKDATDRYLLAVLAVDDGQRKVWLGAPMSLRRFQQVRSGGMGLREAFRSVEGASLVEVTYSRDADEPSHPAVRWIDAASVGDELLPMAGEALVGYVGEDGIEARVAYRVSVDDVARFVRADGR